ncbi:hypothetical protein COCC4DRAFT_127864 [Bipolaris maydis ATCC 48331]|uniref:Uncharacterized protein n=2 Tax=Cochliobolus heterostrophus TaxID=5016 RepID=M2TVG6_COCH5|nr:uncharacterized protein COCC4DRAFT_127864 [Bipolaris maydis ATCC 48331]EMD90534.1 hypothetical protein COCHEDRAFT_1215507 [Bipolaris maydis C5]KAH7555471.1 hypothetical protein BM1_07094 [Bipolaris maydis]ENI09254.1 hypothetical protein COCC4DRAFT_127864 [Bipolaris maydis ATCC 48331]KAJ5058408.1 hypothetical protein J3E74DRAFT_6845 [Bipolaris maydis]KAJ6195650.1 hypothetical protein J3E72DRAFT_7629 [Bipolaris maydis]
MFARIATRAPITAAFAAKRVTPTAMRFNSSSSSSSAARMMEMAAQAERPNATEVAVPVMWALCGALTFAAWNRVSERNASHEVEKLLIV